MSAEAKRLYEELLTRGLEFGVEGDQLRIRAPSGAIDATLRDRLRALKPELLALLTGRDAGAPLTGPQRQLWFVARVEPDSAALELVLRLRLRGPLDRRALGLALDALVDRHEALRTRFEDREGQPIQIVANDRSVCWSGGPTDPLRGRPFVVALEPITATEHDLVLRVHHLVCDGWSMSLLLTELGQLYSAACGGKPIELPPLSIRLGDVARELARREASPNFRARLDAWATRLAGVGAIELPLDRQRPERPSSAGASVTRTLDPNSWTAALGYAQANAATPFMLVAAAVSVVLARWTGSRDLCFGIPLANRPHAQLEAVVGMLVDTLLLRVELDDDALDLSQVLARTQAAVLASFEYADLPLDRVVARLHRDGGRPTVPNVMLNYVAFAQAQPRFAGLDCEVEASMPGSRFDLTIYAYPRAHGLELEAAYRTELFEAASVAALLDQVAQVLAGVLAPPRPWTAMALALDQLELGPEPKPEPLALQPARSHSAWMRATLNTTPAEQVAVVGPDQTITHGQLRARARALASALDQLELGLEREREESPLRVAVIARREPSLVVALLATITAGASFVVLDASYPAAQLIEMLALARPRAWMCLDGQPDEALAHALRQLPRVVEPAGPLPSPDRQPTPRPREHAEAYLAFTSGTSGRARAVHATLDPLAHFLAWYRDTLGIDAHDRFAALSGLGHDPTLRDVFGALIAGARVCMPPREPGQMGAALATWIDAAGVTTLHITPSLARSLAGSATCRLPSLRRVCFGGDQLRGRDVEAWRRLAPNAALFNFYGATETPQAIAVHRISAADERRAIVPIGRGIEGVTLEVQTPAGPAAINELGEIVVCTTHLASGYLGEPELTRARFLSDPSPRYRTGDLGRRQPDGQVICVGRLDAMLKIRGVRVEPAQVEAVIRELSGLDVGVVARASSDGERELVAWLAGPLTTSLDQLRSRLAARLPAAMLPTRFGLIDALPLTANGKLNRHALTERARHEAMDARASGHHEAPAGGLETALATIWSELLERERVGRHDDFFAIGGHSLLAVQLAARVHATLGLELPVPALFEQPTLAGCASAIEQHRAKQLPQLRARPDPGPAQASFAQARIWLLHALDDDAAPALAGELDPRPQLSITHTLRLDAAIDHAALDRALVGLETRHDVLRTTFELRGDCLIQRVGPPRAAVLERGPPPSEAGRARFDLARGPVWRARSWTGTDGSERLELELHHIVGEAGSMRILARDLVELVRAAREQRPPRLPEIELGYADVAAWQRALVDRPRSREREIVAMWRERLAGIEPLELPRARARPPRQGHRGAWLELELEPALARRISARASAAHTSIYAVMLAALTAVLARWCGTTDVTIGSPVGLRPHPATANMLGPFLNLVCLRLDASGDPSLAELLARARACALEAFASSELPFEQVLQALYENTEDPDRPARDLGRTPLFQVMLNMVDVGETERSWADLGAQRVLEREPIARYDLAVYAIRHPGGLKVCSLYDADLFDAEQIELLLEHLHACLQALVAQPEQRLSALALRRPGDLLEQVTPSPVAPQPVFERFAAIASAQPDAVAIDTRLAQTTYATLHTHARALAGALTRAAVSAGPGRAGLLVDEDARMAAAMLGALAAGVAYVPLDPRLPPARLQELIEDAQLELMLCSSDREALATTLAPDLPRLVIDASNHATTPAPQSTAQPTASPEQLAYLLYTSGSTGRPKAVMQSQANLLHHACTYAARLRLGPGDRVSLVATHAFDAAVMDIYGALLSGATLCPIDLRGEALVDLPGELRARSISVFHSTPTVFRHLVASLDAERGAAPRLEAIRWVVLGGEEARRDDAMAITRWFGPATRLINGLGPTECTLALQELVDTLGVPDSLPDSLPIGAPVPGVRVRLETPVGEQPALYGVGEIVIESPYLALGYWRRPQQSAAAFSQVEGQRRYRSGDLGRALPGGRLAFAGRRDGFFKLRGHRIEPGEIEAKLRALPGVRAAAVDLREDRSGPARLLGFYVASEGSPDPAALRDQLAEALPSAMVPAVLVRVDDLPRTPTGKLDRRALALRPAPAAATRAHADPSDAAQAAVWAVWTDLLGHPPPGVDVDFFASGGDSLGAARLVSVLEQALGLRVSLAELFEGMSVARLARRLTGAGAGDRAGDREPSSSRARLHQLADGPGSAIVCVLPPGQRPRSLAALAELLAGPMWALEPPSFGERGPLPTLEAITADMLELLAKLELTRGPFLLAGVSNGGLLAWELARVLGERERSPRAVVLLDSLPPEQLAARPWEQRDELEHLAAFGYQLTGDAALVSALAEVAPTRPPAHALERILASGHLDPSVSAHALDAIYQRYLAHGARVWRVLSALDLRDGVAAPRPEIERVLIEASEGRSRQLGEHWGARVKGLRVVAVPGSHLGMLAPPHVNALALALRQLVSEFGRP
ncbi:putative non ribosomal peptide synthetase protein [Enhygromyxa salina]|uniref:Putative non ribosomal peptide synthetase protein n=1 Tax=Enhygromyxa salina TaxID=215803 RepID=A0A0C2CYC6_9BACT|nr:condensation domain-containing protein [Enhygromyxa salina]KIG14640.1 putative non ribosomal peptide synthetase protein [Enhygromyxa salina]